MPTLTRKTCKKKEKVLEPKKYFVINIETFNVDVAFFINFSEEEMKDYWKKKGKDLYDLVKDIKTEDDEGTEKGQMYPLKRGFAVRLWFYKDCLRLNVCLLAHEVSHLAYWILSRRRVTQNDTTDEVYAYLTEEITKKFLFKWY